MKVKFLLALPVIACMTACNSDDSPSTEKSSSQAIAFTSYVGQSTKASISGIDQLHADGFRVIAVDHANDWNTLTNEDKVPDFMYHQAINWNTDMNAYQYSPVKYWPVDGNKVSFFAYSPAEMQPLVRSVDTRQSSAPTPGLNPSRNDEGTSPYLAYTAGMRSDEQVDIITSHALNCTAETTNAHGKGAVYFDFTHALSKIGFAAKLKNKLQAGTTLTVRNISVLFRQTEAGGIKHTGRYFMDTKTWDVADYTLVNYGDEGENLLADATVIPSVTESTTLNADNKYLMMIPQQYEAGMIEVSISYTITYKDPADAEAEPVTTLERTSIVTLPAIHNEAEVNIGWEQNKSYTYVIEIAPDAISFDSPEIGQWYSYSDFD